MVNRVGGRGGKPVRTCSTPLSLWPSVSKAQQPRGATSRESTVRSKCLWHHPAEVALLTGAGSASKSGIANERAKRVCSYQE